MTDSPWIYEVTEENFERDVLARSDERPVVIDFWAPWCGPCRSLTPLLEKIVNERQGEVLLAKVNVDEAQQLAAAFNIQAIPAVKAIRERQLVLEFNGVLPEEHLREFFNRISGSPADLLVREGNALEQESPQEAETCYRDALKADPEHDGAKVGLARLLYAQGKEKEVLELLDSVSGAGEPAAEAQRIRSQMSLKQLDAGGKGEAELRQALTQNPDNAEVLYELGLLLAKQGKHREALEALLSAGERDFKLASTKVREAMVQIFYALGTGHPLSDEYRSKLALLLN